MTEITLSRGEQRQLVVAQSADIIINQQEGSVLTLTLLLLDRTATVNITVNHTAESARTYLYGLVLATNRQEVNINTHINHLKGGGVSQQTFKYILAQDAQASFHGLLYIAPDAQKTEARQTNRNILLSDAARMHTEPQLEIYADDVKASHGASTGQLDESALFYMQQRCIEPPQARLMLLQAFTADIMQTLPPTEQTEYETIITDLLKKYATQ